MTMSIVVLSYMPSEQDYLPESPSFISHRDTITAVTAPSIDDTREWVHSSSKKMPRNCLDTSDATLKKEPKTPRVELAAVRHTWSCSSLLELCIFVLDTICCDLCQYVE